MEENKELNGKNENFKDGVIAVLIIIILILSGFLIYKSLNTSEKVESEPKETLDINKESSTVKESTTKEESNSKAEARNLTTEELNFFKNHFNEIGINGFIIQEYKDVKDIHLPSLFYNGLKANDETTPIEDEEYKKATNQEEIVGSLIRIYVKDAEEFLKNNVGARKIEKTDMSCYTYVESSQKYYLEKFDTNYLEVEKCTSGRLLENGNYEVISKILDQDIEFKTVLKKSGNNYMFVSNVATRGGDSIPGYVCG